MNIQNINYLNRLLRMQKKLKQVLYSTKQSIGSSIWFFQPSLYEVIIIYPIAIFPYIKISTESPIQHFEVIQHLQSHEYFLILVTKTGIWIAYELRIQENLIKIYQKSKSSLLTNEQSVVGVHLLTDDLLIVFVKEKGKLEYNFIERNQKQKSKYASKSKTLVNNKDFGVEIRNQKMRKNNLYNEYQGRDVLGIKNENKILESIVNFNTKELFVVTQDINSKVCSVNKYFLYQYEIITGPDVLLNLPCKPMQILLCMSIVILNLGSRILLWSRNITSSFQLPSPGLCCGIKHVDKFIFMLSIIRDIDTHVYSMTIAPTPKDSHNLANIKFQKFLELKHNDLIIQFTPTQYPKSLPGLSITSKLDIVEWLKDGSHKKVLSNMQAQIKSAKLQKLKHSNFLQVIKNVGGAIEQKIVTNNRIVTCVDEYQHNMLIKMCKLQAYLCRNGEGQIFLTSPIIGTLKLAISFNEQKQNKKEIQKTNIRISLRIKQPNMVCDEQSLCLNTLNFQQLTPTKIISQKSKLTVSQIFEGKAGMVLAGAFISNYVALVVEKQVHIFNLQPKPKRMHIICFDSEIKNVIPVNSVNLWGTLLWDGTFQVFRIQEKQSIKMHEVSCLGHNFNDNLFSFNVIINTAPHIITIVGNYMIIASNDPLHIYQPQKTSLKGILLDGEELGSFLYPAIDLSDSKGAGEKHIILSNIGSRWMLMSIPVKMLIKNFQQIKIEVQQIIAFPNIQSVIIALVKDSNIFLLTANKMVVCSLQTGSIIYNTVFPFSNPQRATHSLSYLRNWLSSQRVQHKNYRIQARGDMNETHPHLIKLNENRVLVYNEKQIWYASMCKKQIKLISYFSMPNDSFLEFRNNLGVQELQNYQFMDIFAQKLPITSVAALSDTLIAVLFSKMIVLIQISSSGGIIIKQELLFAQCPGLISITEFVGIYEQMSFYLKDQSQRLVVLKQNKKQKKYFLELQNQLDDEIVCIHRLKGWNDRTKKISLFSNQQKGEFEEMILKRDGQMIAGNNSRQLYI